MFKKFLNNETGATMIEYGLIGALISVAAIGVLILLGGGIQSVFNTSASVMSNAVS